jgi:uracil-DNA glycosylase
MRKKMLIIGQAPGRSVDILDGKRVFEGTPGRRLANLCGLTLDEFLSIFDTINVLERFPGKQGKGDSFPIEEARLHAAEIDVEKYDLVLLAGKNVAAAFGWVDAQYMEWRERFAVIPHPSGVNRWWNNPRNMESMRRFMRSLFLP